MELNLKMSIKRKITFFFFLILLIGSGFLRDFFMININHVLKHLEQDIANYAYSSFRFLENWSIKEIGNLKWTLTILFFFYFWGVSYAFLKSYFSPLNVKAISQTYISLIVLAGILYLFGMISGLGETMYHIVRTITGLTHSFMPTMVVFLYLKYFPKD